MEIDRQDSVVINSVRKAIRILEIFSASEPRLTLGEISRRLAMPKSTAHNFLNTLMIDGYVEQLEDEHYALGTAALALTQHIRVNVEVRDPAAPFLRQLADATDESVYLTVKDGDYALYIYAVESPRRLLARTAVGDRAHLHATSVGKAILAGLDDDAVLAIAARTGLPAYTPATLTTPVALLAALQTIRTRGYATDCGEHEQGTYCIGAPVLGGRGRMIGACSLSGIDPEIVGASEAALAALVTETARQISRHMGYVPASPGMLNGLPMRGQRAGKDVIANLQSPISG